MKLQKGTALIIVLALIAVMASYAAANGANLRHLDDHLNRLDQKQRQKFK